MSDAAIDDAARVKSALVRYGALRDGLPAQQRIGDPTVVLDELSASEGLIAEAETLRK